MSDEPKPQPIIGESQSLGRVAKPSQGEAAELDSIWEELLGKLRVLAAANQALVAHFESCAYTDKFKQAKLSGLECSDNEKYKTVSHIPGMTMHEAYDFVFGHYGITSEYGNGVGNLSAIADFSSRPGMSDLLVSLKQIALDNVKEKSELTKSIRGRSVAEKAFITRENGLQALERCTKELPKWVAANRELLGEENAQKFDGLIVDYRNAVAPVIAIMEPVVEAHILTKDKDTRSPRG